MYRGRLITLPVIASPSPSVTLSRALSEAKGSEESHGAQDRLREAISLSVSEIASALGAWQ